QFPCGAELQRRIKFKSIELRVVRTPLLVRHVAQPTSCIQRPKGPRMKAPYLLTFGANHLVATRLKANRKIRVRLRDKCDDLPCCVVFACGCPRLKRGGPIVRNSGMRECFELWRPVKRLQS